VRRTVVRKGPAAGPPARIPRRPAGAAVPLSFGQEQLWLHGQLAPEAPLYTESLTIHRRGPLDAAAFVSTFDAIVRRHEMWRTTLAWADGRLTQEVDANPAPRLRLTDLRHMPATLREAEAHRLALADLREPFDLFREPGVRARLVTLSDGDHRLYLALHHMVFDGISVYRVFLPELAAQYEAHASGSPAELDAPSLQYGDFACWQRASFDEATAERLTAYWRRRLAGASPMIDLPTDRPRPRRQSFRGGLVRLDFPPDVTAMVRSTALTEGCTLFMCLLASFAVTLHRWSRQTDLLIGSVSGGRDYPELERVIGYFLRILVVRVDLGGDPTFREVLRRVRETLLEALCYDGLPFQRMVRALTPARHTDRSPLFQVTFSIEPPMPGVGSGWDISEMDAGAVASKFDLSIEVEDKGELIHVRAIYSEDLFDASTIQHVVQEWRRVLGRAVVAPERRLQELVGPEDGAVVSTEGEAT
jgi:condensation domain-containing protein